MTMWTLFLLLLVLVMGTGWAAPPFSGLLKGTVVAAGCLQHVGDVSIDVESRGKRFRGISRTDTTGYFELDLRHRVPAWKPGDSLTLHFSKKGFQSTVRNLHCSMDACETLTVNMQHVAAVSIGGQVFGPEVAAQRSKDCSTIFVLPHAVPPSAEQAQLTATDLFTLHMGITTHLQELDVQPPTLPSPEDVSLVLLKGVRGLEPTPKIVKELGQQLQAMAMFYGILLMRPDASGTRVPHITSNFLPITSIEDFSRTVNILRRIPLPELETNPEAYDWIIQRLARHTLFALSAREFERVQLEESHPENFQRLERIRAYILAERKRLPQQGQPGQARHSAQQRAEHSDARVLARLLAHIETALDALTNKGPRRNTTAKKDLGS